MHTSPVSRRNHFRHGCQAVPDWLFYKQMDTLRCNLFADRWHPVVAHGHQCEVGVVFGQQPGQICIDGGYLRCATHFLGRQHLLVCIPKQNRIHLRRLGQGA